MIVLLAKKANVEPRFQLGPYLQTAQAFGFDVDRCAHGFVVPRRAVGFPVSQLAAVPTGRYFAQVVFQPYAAARPGGRRTIYLPIDRGEGRHWQIAPGNVIGRPRWIELSSHARASVTLIADHVLPTIAQSAPAIDRFLDGAFVDGASNDPRWVRRVTVHSRLLSAFWGRDIKLTAVVLLPPGWAEHPNARYPLVVQQGHFHRGVHLPVQFRTAPPPPDLPEADQVYAEQSWAFSQAWSGGRLPKVLLVSIQHANPYYDDSYAVNSANLGPYGDVIVTELLPAVETELRGIGQPWARAVYGTSTGGWAALASKVFYPRFYNAAWAYCPDAIDFSAFGSVNLYADVNAYRRRGDFADMPVPALRDADGVATISMEQLNRLERVVGEHGRSGRQFDALQAIYSPVGPDGYPRPIWDKATGAIDPVTAIYWRDHYDLSWIMARDWRSLAPDLAGKLHFTAGDLDSNYLELAVHAAEKRLSSLSPAAGASFEYGPRKGHCYTGLPEKPVAESLLSVSLRVLPEIGQALVNAAPPGPDRFGWRY